MPVENAFRPYAPANSNGAPDGSRAGVVPIHHASQMITKLLATLDAPKIVGALPFRHLINPTGYGRILRAAFLRSGVVEA